MASSTPLSRFRGRVSTSLRYSNNEPCRIRLWNEDRDALPGRGIRDLGTCRHGPLALHRCTFPMRWPLSVDIHIIDIHHSIAPSQSSEMLHEGGRQKRTYITTSSTCLSATLSSPPVCSMCSLARLPRQLTVNLSRWIARHQMDNRGGASRSQHKCMPACLIQ